MFKRLFDIIAAGMGLLVLSPLFVLLILLVKYTSPGGVFYRAKRVGLDGELFKLLKFRSMVTNADQTGPGITGAGDRRVTKIGRILRKSKLDELPQLINVLRGEMSLVGPRPEDPRYVAYYTDNQREILSVRPGMTSLASVTYRDEESMLAGEDRETYYIEHIMPAKLAIDLEYIHHHNVWRDIGIIFRTFRVIIFPKKHMLHPIQSAAAQTPPQAG